MEKFVVSALKYRPNSFETVVGQQSITQTLENAIANDELAKAYLFCGPRGVGKTTCARIFAKAINEKTGEDIGDLSYNLFELDAASNNSVDDIRRIIDQVRVPPQVGKYKVYIIDEVHMLSKQAFNAFLKTLEEPPEHAIFVMATTEKHKVLPTILSRCQIYDFKRINVKDMVAHLEKVATKEGIAFEKEALHLIAQKADGALRDALSVFDQMVSFTAKNLTRAGVAENLNILDYDYYFKAVNNFIHADISSSLLLFDEIVERGFNPLHYVSGLNEHFRNLLVVKDAQTVRLLDQTESIKEQYIAQSTALSQAQLLTYLEAGQKTMVDYRASKNKRLLVEVYLLKLCSFSGISQEKKTPVERVKPSSPPSPPPVKINPKNQPTHKLVIEDPNAPAVKLASDYSSESSPQKPTLTVDATLVASAPKADKEVNSPTIGPDGSGMVSEPAPVFQKPVVENIASGPNDIDQLGTPVINRPKLYKIKKSKNKARNSISLDVEIEEELETNTEHRRETFSQTALKKYWNQYAETVAERGKRGFASSLRANIPQITENSVLTISLENQVQVENINEERSALLEFLRKELKNDDISIETVVIEEDAPIVNLGPTEQLTAMIDSNKNLHSLIKDLDLDLEL